MNIHLPEPNGDDPMTRADDKNIPRVELRTCSAKCILQIWECFTATPFRITERCHQRVHCHPASNGKNICLSPCQFRLFRLLTRLWAHHECFQNGCLKSGVEGEALNHQKSLKIAGKLNFPAILSDFCRL